MRLCGCTVMTQPIPDNTAWHLMFESFPAGTEVQASSMFHHSRRRCAAGSEGGLDQLGCFCGRKPGGGLEREHERVRLDRRLLHEQHQHRPRFLDVRTLCPRDMLVMPLTLQWHGFQPAYSPLITRCQRALTSCFSCGSGAAVAPHQQQFWPHSP